MNTYIPSFSHARNLSSWEMIQTHKTSDVSVFGKSAMPIPPLPPKLPYPGHTQKPPHIPPMPPDSQKNKVGESVRYKPYQKSVCVEQLAQQRQQASRQIESWLKHTEDSRFSLQRKREICLKFLQLLQCLS